jgi:hypothetical protein
MMLSDPEKDPFGSCNQKTIEEIIDNAKQQNKVIGFLKYLYYVSPFGYLFNNKEHQICIAMTI